MQTDIREWREVARCSQTAWEPRSQIIAKLIRPFDTVLDIGAGNQKLKRFISPRCTYIPVDCVDELPGTFVVDFNKEFRLPATPFTVAVCAGSLEYINDLAGFFSHFSSVAEGHQIIFTYMLEASKSRRSRMKVHNHFTTVEALLNAIGDFISDINVVAERKRVVYISATLGRGDTRWISDTPINALLEDRRNAREPARASQFWRKLGRIFRPNSKG